MKIMTFYNQALFHRDNRPYADVKLITNTSNHTTKCLVDTGADYLQLPNSVAAQAGLSLASATVKHVKNATGGTTPYHFLTKVDVEIEGVLITTDIMFGPANCLCLAGRTCLLTAFDVGFDNKSWHRD